MKTPSRTFTVASPVWKRAFNEAEAAIYIARSRSYLSKTRMTIPPKGITPGPSFRRIGPRSICYMRENLDAWLDQFAPTNEPQTQEAA